MAARSGQREGAEAFTAPAQVNQRRYEALRAYFTEGLSYAEAGERLGYTRWAMINLVRDYRAGKLELFARPRQARPSPGVAPAKDRARGRVIALRRQGLSAYEIPPGWPPRAPRSTAHRSGRSSPRKASACCCATPSPRPAPPRTRPARHHPAPRPR